MQAEGQNNFDFLEKSLGSFFWFLEFLLDFFPVYQLALVMLLTLMRVKGEKSVLFFFKKKIIFLAYS